MTTLKISEAIIKILRLSKSVTDLVDYKTFRIVAEGGTKYPYLVVRRDSINDSLRLSNKDEDNDTQSVTIQCVSDKYDVAINIAEAVINTLEGNSYECDGFNIEDIQLVTASEDYIENAYVLNITFSIDTQKEIR